MFIVNKKLYKGMRRIWKHIEARAEFTPEMLQLEMIQGASLWISCPSALSNPHGWSNVATWCGKNEFYGWKSRWTIKRDILNVRQLQKSWNPKSENLPPSYQLMLNYAYTRNTTGNWVERNNPKQKQERSEGISVEMSEFAPLFFFFNIFYFLF